MHKLFDLVSNLKYLSSWFCVLSFKPKSLSFQSIFRNLIDCKVEYFAETIFVFLNDSYFYLFCISRYHSYTSWELKQRIIENNHFELFCKILLHYFPVCCLILRLLLCTVACFPFRFEVLKNSLSGKLEIIKSFKTKPLIPKKTISDLWQDSLHSLQFI